ncbi:MAG: hypothetical protein LBT18_05450 [Endomicrobium sp.]|jgi:transposase|nr:hypothetical protein [Endomicrobium sp.]
MHTKPTALYAEIVGIDVCKDKIDVYETKNNTYCTVSNDKKGINSLLKSFKPTA